MSPWCQSIQNAIRPNDYARKRAHFRDRNLRVLILTEAISRPKGIIVAVLYIHPYLVVDDDQVVFRRQRLRPISS